MAESNETNYQLVKVFIRPRPFTEGELDAQLPSIIHSICGKKITVKLGSSEKNYTFDAVFGENSCQNDIYQTVVDPLIEYIISGYNCSVFAYGQTGTGKTHTMIGSDINRNTDFSNDPSVGIIPRAASSLFSQLKEISGKVEYTVTISFTEIYNEEVRDLLVHNSPPLKIYDDPENKGSIYIKGLTETTVCNTDEVYEWLTIGTMERQTAQTNLNRHSSRSHTIFTLVVHTRETTIEGEEILKTGKLHLIDLAGSENIGRSGATDMRAREAGTINKSLLTLGKVIKSLAQKMQHVPYRDSKLTRILQDSLGGKTKTCMIATFSPCADCWDETLSTLDYAHVARKVANCPQVNVNRKQLHIFKDLKKEIQELRQQLSAARTGDGFYISNESYEQLQSNLQKDSERVTYLMKEAQVLEECKLIKEQQYKDLNDSFLTTKTYLENITVELEENKLKEKENTYMINHMEETCQELNATRDLLLAVSKTSIKHEEIYHEKYQNQSNITLNNANTAERTFLTSINCLSEIQNSSDNFVKNKEIQVNQIKDVANSLKNNHLKNLEELTEMQLALHMTETKSELNFETIFQGSDYKETNLNTHTNGIFKCTTSLQMEKQNEFEKDMDMIKQYIVTKKSEMGAISAQCLKPIEDECHEEFLQNNSYLSISKRIDNTQNSVRDNNKLKCSLEQQLLALEKDEERGILELADINQLDNEINQLLTKYDNKKLLPNFKETLCQSIECQNEGVKALVSMVSDVTHGLQENKQCYTQKILADKNRLQEYFSELTRTIRDNLVHYNTQIQKSFENLKSQNLMVQNKLDKSASEYSESLEKQAEAIAQCTNNHNCDMKKFIQQTIENVEGLESSVVSTAHAGDTPEKKIYTYPKKITNELSREVLIKQFINSSNNSP